MNWSALSVVIVLSASIVGCAAHGLELASPNSHSPTRLACLSQHGTTREEVLTLWGPAPRRLEGDRILAYHLDAKYRVVDNPGYAGWWKTRYHLILVFDSEGTLQQHRLLRVR